MKLLGITEIFDHFDEFVLGLFNSGNILERHPVFVHGQKLGLGLTKAHGTTTSRLHLMTEQEENDQNDEENGENLDHEHPKHA